VSRRWDRYCERGAFGCLDQNCPCVDSFHYRYKCARARGAGWLAAFWSAL
jgi:hypothetical protein